ncbi:hypothetical protein NL676_034428 [Syzygium grande]|nr:hypothetical protein NL676_034428 [Syzygium grande]
MPAHWLLVHSVKMQVIRPTMTTTIVLMLSSNSIALPSPWHPAFFVQSRSQGLSIPMKELESSRSTSETMPLLTNGMSVTELYPRYVETKVLDAVTTIKCPGLECEGVLQINSCRQILPENVLHMWERSLCKAMFLKSQKFDCPFKNCSALLIKDYDGGECEEFQSLNEDERGSEDLIVRELAKEK